MPASAQFSRLPSSTVLELLTDWLGFANLRIRPRTQHDYAGLIRRYVADTPLAVRPLVDLEPGDLQHPISQLAVAGHVIAARHLYVLLRQAFKWAMKARKVSWNPMDAVSPPRLPRRTQAVFTRDQALKLIAEAPSDPLGNLWITMLGTGVRVGEALALKWSDLEGEVLSVQRNLVELPGRGNPALFGEPKSASGFRQIVLPEVVGAALGRQRDLATQRRREAGRRWREHDLVFPTCVGTPHNSGNIRARWKRFCLRAGLPPVRLYTTRHTCATLLLASGENPKAIAEVLGHANVVMLLQVYAHPLAEDRRRIAATLGKALSAT